MRDFCGHNRNHAGGVIEFGAVIYAYAAPRDDFVRLELRFVNVVLDAFVRSDPDKMIAERAASFFRGDDVLEFYTFESRVLAPDDIFERFRIAGESEFAVVEFFEKFFFHSIVLLLDCGLRL